MLFDRLGALPLEVWDEAQLANNALEMAKTGLSLITTYDGIPDHYNTKPPLLIWLMSISIRVLGPNEWGVRLPSALAALATVVIVFAFCKFRLKRQFVGFSAILVLLAGNNYGYIRSHAARFGDYDATLALWTTGYLLAGYMYIHAPPSKRRLWILLCTAGIVLAFLTKTVEGLIFLPALLIYAVAQGRIVEMLRSSAAYLASATVLLICAGYYFAREQLDPGYFAAPLCVLAGLGVIIENDRILRHIEADVLADDRNLTSVFLRGPVVQYESPKKFIVIQQGFDPSNYYGPTSFYVKALRAAGHSIQVQPPSAAIQAGFDAAVMCGVPVTDAMTPRIAFEPIVIDGECGIYRFAAK